LKLYPVSIKVRYNRVMTYQRFFPAVYLFLYSLLISPAVARAASDPFDHEYASWHEIYKQSVHVQGNLARVDYAGLKKNPTPFNALTKSLADVKREQFDSFSKDQRLAFLINSYNIFTIKLILDHYPLKSIKDLGGVFSKPWGIRFVPLLGEKRTLDEIEHELIRKNFDEPRIHIALVCAAKGCPPLHAYTAAQLEAELENGARSFLTDPKLNHYDSSVHKLYLCKLFDWYQNDFKKKFGSVKAYVTPKIAKGDKPSESSMMSEQTDISYLDYDWSLNDLASGDSK